MVQHHCSHCSAITETDKTFCPECGKSYFAEPPNVPAQTAGTNGLAIASMVLGIIWFFGVSSFLAVILGHVALNKLNRPDNRQGGRGMAIAGLILGYIGIGIFALIRL